MYNGWIGQGLLRFYNSLHTFGELEDLIVLQNERQSEAMLSVCCVCVCGITMESSTCIQKVYVRFAHVLPPDTRSAVAAERLPMSLRRSNLSSIGRWIGRRAHPEERGGDVPLHTGAQMKAGLIN